MLEIKSLNMNYNDFEALKDINLSIGKGEIFGVIGMSGAGKTSLIRCICGLESPQSGAVTINNKNIYFLTKQEQKSLANEIGVVFQGYHLFMQKTVFDNIALPLIIQNKSKDFIAKRVNQLLELIDLKNKAFTYPSKLSGGQKQRVAIARALANDPKVLLLDEITSALDSVNTKMIMELLKDINDKSQVTIILITHEINIVRLLCERMCVLNDGRIIETGKVKDIFLNPRDPVTKLLIGKEE